MHAKLGATLVLSMLAWAGTYFNITMFGTIAFVFGSVVALVAVRLVGLGGAIVVAVAGASYTWFAWGHPYAILIFTLEILVVGLSARRSDNIALIDMAYWVLLGAPLTFMTYGGMLELSWASSAFIALKLSVNAVFNAVVAGLVLGVLPGLLPKSVHRLPKMSFDALLFHTLAFVALIASLALTIADSKDDERNRLQDVSTFLWFVGNDVLQSLADDPDARPEADWFKARLAATLGMPDVGSTILNNLAISKVASDGSMVTILGEARSFGSSGSVDLRLDGLAKWSPAAEMHAIRRARESVYFVSLPTDAVPGFTEVRVELRAAPVLDALEASGRQNLLLLTGAMVFVFLASKLLTLQLGTPLRRLSDATDSLPRAILSGGDMSGLPESNIREIDQVAGSFREMARDLSRMFRERDELNRTLEDRVAERTRQLDLMSRVARQTTNGVVVTDPDGRVTWVNEAFEEMTGFAAHEMLGQVPGRLLQRTPPPPEIMERMRNGLDKREGFHVELLNHTKAGAPYWIELRCNPMEDSEGQHIGFIAIENDVTERMAMQLSLRQSLERLQLATEVAELGVWSIDPTTGKIDWNEQNYRLAGISPEQDIRTEWIARTHPEDVASVELKIRDLIANQSGDVSFEFRLHHPVKGQRTLSSIARAIQENGRLVRITGVTWDITDERLAADLLRRSVQHTEAILNNVEDAIVTIDTKGLISSCNRATERIFGYKAEDMMGKSISMIMPSNHAAQHDRYLRSYQRGVPSRVVGQMGQFEAIRANGEVFPVELAVTEIDEGDGRFFMGILRDVTERKKIEKMQSEFLATVNHELRTPLTSIKGTLSLLKNGVVGELNQNGERVVTAALRNAEQLGRMVEEMLDLERMQQGKLEIVRSVERLDLLVVQAVEMNRVIAGNRNIQLVMEPEPLPKIHVSVDGSRVIQILTNFLSNAIKFSHQGDSVSIRIAVHNRNVRISVIDHGPGIPGDKQSILFQKFAQLDTSDSRRHRGAGLGLAISRELANRMGGRVGLHSVEGDGSEFWVEFPCVAGLPQSGANTSIDETRPQSEMATPTGMESGRD